jgi:hypothetical protein
VIDLRLDEYSENLLEPLKILPNLINLTLVLRAQKVIIGLTLLLSIPIDDHMGPNNNGLLLKVDHFHSLKKLKIDCHEYRDLSVRRFFYW